MPKKSPTKPSVTSAKTGSAASVRPPATQFWLVKSEPEVFSIQDLARAKNKTTHWDGVRNYQARNTLRDLMKVGDQVLYYHSNANPPAIVGLAEVVREGYPDHTAWDATSDHFDPKSTAANPIWYMVDIRLVQVFDRPLELPMLKQQPRLKSMVLVQRGSRLSVQPVTRDEFQTVLELAGR